ncbi:MAG: GTP cyclohydrolase II, partial [Planctomycetes bacterium]|nr:GTP cyclohydrolase II [Planctomycetota bacterium]
SLIDHAALLKSRIHNPDHLELVSVQEVRLLPGVFLLHSFYSHIDERHHWAFCHRISPLPSAPSVPLVRIESECFTGHVFGSLLCDCGDQLSQGLGRIALSGCGLLIYLRQEGRGIGLLSKLKAYRLQQREKLDTVDANLALGEKEDARDYIIGAQILRHLGIDQVKLLTNNPAKVSGIERYGIRVEERVPHVIPPHNHNRHYLKTKQHRMGHLF